MKKLISIIALALLVGCATTNPQTAAFKSIGTIVTTVDVSMLSWGDYVRAGLASNEQENQVRRMYSKYQSSMLVTKTMVLTYVDSPEGQKSLQTTLQAVGNASSELISLINSFLTKAPQ